jgi:paraquat-inducible protein B
MMVNLDFVNVPPPMLTFTWEPEETYIPSYPTTLESMISVAEKIATNLEKIDFSETVGAITNLTTKLTQAVEEANVQGLSSSIESCAVQVRQLATTLNDVLATTDPSLLGQDLKTVASSLSSLSASLSEEVPALTAQARETLEIAKGSLSSITSATTSLLPLLEQWGADEALAILPEETANSMEQLSQTLRVFESLLQSLRERPSRLLFDDEP